MRTQIRAILLTGLLFLGLATGVQAQDKYEFATVRQWGASELKISIEGKPFEIKLLEKKIKDQADHTEHFAFVSKMQDDGWEVYGITFSEAGFMTTVLRRKKA